MRWPRRGILIRLVIYLPLIGFLAWRAWSSRAPSDDAALDPPRTQTFVGPDGKTVEVIQLSPEQIEQQFGLLPGTSEPKAPEPVPGPE